jgi:hypothetical protein
MEGASFIPSRGLRPATPTHACYMWIDHVRVKVEYYHGGVEKMVCLMLRFVGENFRGKILKPFQCLLEVINVD